jgi:hypothetical protein
MRNELAIQQTENKKLKKESKSVEADLWMARHVIDYYTKHGLMELKKNGILGRILKRIFSRVPKKPSKPEERS